MALYAPPLVRKPLEPVARAVGVPPPVAAPLVVQCVAAEVGVQSLMKAHLRPVPRGVAPLPLKARQDAPTVRKRASAV